MLSMKPDTRRTFLRNCSGAVSVPLVSAQLPASKRPNILYIHSHDTGRYIQPYGHAVPAPNLQRLAESGVLFRRAFSAAPTCSPSRAAKVPRRRRRAARRGLARARRQSCRQRVGHGYRAGGWRSSGVGHDDRIGRPGLSLREVARVGLGHAEVGQGGQASAVGVEDGLDFKLGKCQIENLHFVYLAVPGCNSGPETDRQAIAVENRV